MRGGAVGKSETKQKPNLFYAESVIIHYPLFVWPIRLFFLSASQNWNKTLESLIMKRLMHTLAASFLLVSIVLFNVHLPMAQAAKTNSLPATNSSLDLQSGGSSTNFPLYAANFSNSNVIRLDSSASQTLVTSGGNISNSFGLAIDSSGNLYTGDMYSKIIKISPGGAQSVFVANTGDLPYGLACDDNDNLYYADGWRIMKVTPAGVQSVFSSNGYLSYPVGLAFDSRGNLYAANYQAVTNSVVKITPAGVQSVFTPGRQYHQPLGAGLRRQRQSLRHRIHRSRGRVSHQQHHQGDAGRGAERIRHGRVA